MFEKYKFDQIKATQIININKDNHSENTADTEVKDKDEEEVIVELSNQISEISHDFKLNNLTQDLKIKRVSINELQRATDDVKLFFFEFIKIKHIKFNQFKNVICFYVPQLLQATIKEFIE